MIKRIFAWVILISGFTVYLFFRKYNGELIPFPLLFKILSWIMMVVGFVLVRKTMPIKAIKQREKAEQIKANLIRNGNIIDVELKKL